MQRLGPLPARGRHLRVAFAITISALGGCGGDREPRARAAAPTARADTVVPTDTVSTISAAPAWTEQREAWDRCRRAPGQPPPPVGVRDDSARHEDLSHGLAILCTLRRGGHPVRLVVQGSDWGNPVAVLVYDPPAATTPADTLPIEDSERPYAGADLVEGEDMNGDGWTDVRVMTYFGSGGRMFDTFRYDPGRGRFEKDTVLSGQGNFRHVAGTRCARSAWKTSAYDHSWMEWCWRGGRWVPTQAESWEMSATLSTRETFVGIHERREFRGRRMRLVSADTTRERIPR